MIRYWLSILALVVAVATCSAATFKTRRLQQIAAAAGVDGVSIRKSCDTLLTYRGQDLRIKSDIMGNVSHIGYALFSELDAERLKSAAMRDFIERYALELELSLDGRSAEERMDIDKVHISRGTWQMLRRASTGSLTDVEEINRRMYRLTWNVSGKELRITVPADCQLILGADALELENIVERDVKNIPTDYMFNIQYDNTKVSSADGVKIVERGHYLNEMIRGDLYFVDKEGDVQLYCDKRNPSRSISNIMLTGQFARQIPMLLTINKYGYKSSKQKTTLQQFLAYCVEEGCTLYFGIKTSGDNRLTGTLFARNDALGYNHVLSVVFPTDIISGGNGIVESTLYAYIPLHNVTEKFFK